MRDDNGKPFIDTLYNVPFSPDLCNQLFSIIILMNLGHACLFYKVFGTDSFGDNENKAVTLLHSAQIKTWFFGKNEEKVKFTKANS